MRIDLVITELYVGGAERCLTELAIGLAQRRDDVRVASIGSLPTGEQSSLVGRLRDAAVEVFSCDCNHPWQYPLARRRLVDWMQSSPPDVVQTMLIHANIVGTLAAETARVPLRVGGVRVAERSWMRARIEAYAMRKMHKIVCVSDSVQRFVEHHHRPKAPLHVIGNAIDCAKVDSIAPSQWNVPQWNELDPAVLLFIGRLDHQKGIDRLFELVPGWLRRHPDMHFAMIGDGPLRDAAESFADATGRDRVAILGWLPNPIASIKASRLVVLPTRYEGMPNVILEAMAAAKPVAVTRVEGVAQLLGGATEPQTCDPDNLTQLDRLIDRLWNDATLCVQLGNANRGSAEQRFSIDTMVDAYRRLYRAEPN